MSVACHHRLRWLLLGLAGTVLCTSAVALAPKEVTNAAFADDVTLNWTGVNPSPDFYNIYSGSLSDLLDGARCHGYALQTTSFTVDEEPAIGEGCSGLLSCYATPCARTICLWPRAVDLARRKPRRLSQASGA